MKKNYNQPIVEANEIHGMFLMQDVSDVMNNNMPVDIPDVD